MSKDDLKKLEEITNDEFELILTCIEYVIRKNFNWGSDSPAIGIRSGEEYSRCKTLVYRDCFYEEHTLEYYDDGTLDYYEFIEWVLYQVIWTYADNKGFINFMKKLKERENNELL